MSASKGLHASPRRENRSTRPGPRMASSASIKPLSRGAGVNKAWQRHGLGAAALVDMPVPDDVGSLFDALLENGGYDALKDDAGVKLGALLNNGFRLKRSLIRVAQRVLCHPKWCVVCTEPPRRAATHNATLWTRVALRHVPTPGAPQQGLFPARPSSRGSRTGGSV